MKKGFLLLAGGLSILLVALAQNQPTPVKRLLLQADNEIIIKTGSSSITLKKDGTIRIEGTNIDILSSGELDIKANGNSVLKGYKIREN